MNLQPGLEHIKIIFYFLGKVIIAFGCFMAAPIAAGIILREPNPVLDFLIGMEIALVFGMLLINIFATDKEPRAAHVVIVAFLSWIAAMLLAGIPLYLGRQYKLYLDACFAGLPGFAFLGLGLAPNAHRFTYTHNLWQHISVFGYGIAILLVAQRQHLLSSFKQTIKSACLVGVAYLLVAGITFVALSSRVTTAGPRRQMYLIKPVTEPLNTDKKNQAAILLGILGGVWILTLLKRK